MLTYDQARRKVIEVVKTGLQPLPAESLSLERALGRVLTQEISADRDYPPFDRAIRDGYAVRASEAQPGASLHCVREIKAGDPAGEPLPPGTCAQVMTGAPVPPGADAVVMIEHTRREENWILFESPIASGQHIVQRGAEARAGQSLLSAGTRLGYAELALAAQVGAVHPQVSKRPRIGILSTGDEIVSAAELPGPFQIRNSNAYSLQAQVALAGGDPIVLGNARDDQDDQRSYMTAGHDCASLLLSGGVSAGKYDLVELVLKDLGAILHFDSVAIRPGKPVVFATYGNTFVFGLPGNPVSTMVTFELFVLPAIDLLSGAPPRPLALLEARLAEPLLEKPGLAHFLPARLDWRQGVPEVRPIHWQGSGDIVAVAKSNCLLHIPAEKEKLSAGEMVSVLPRRDLI
ncbi:MAG TPA: gephyrin-like molybdotransferase Glp [Terriglobales bacterium]|nr:gephyrin-like molybdotransferase Glp [Terriglobales bacterium]